jgi:hypothetical protein
MRILMRTFVPFTRNRFLGPNSGPRNDLYRASFRAPAAGAHRRHSEPRPEGGRGIGCAFSCAPLYHPRTTDSSGQIPALGMTSIGRHSEPRPQALTGVIPSSGRREGEESDAHSHARLCTIHAQPIPRAKFQPSE